jgi:hypothetical protein
MTETGLEFKIKYIYIYIYIYIRGCERWLEKGVYEAWRERKNNIIQLGREG